MSGSGLGAASEASNGREHCSFAILLDEPDLISGLVREVLEHVRKADQPQKTLVRAGVLIPSTREIRSVRYSPYVEINGRKQMSRSENVQYVREMDRLSTTLGSVEAVSGILPTPEQLLRSRLEIVSLGSLDEQAAQTLSEFVLGRRGVRAAFLFNEQEVGSNHYFWHSLSPLAIVSGDVLLWAIEDAPEFVSGTDGSEYLVYGSGPHTSATEGGFYQFHPRWTTLVEERFRDTSLPQEFAELRWPDPYDTPAGAAIRAIRTSAGPRISNQDDRSAEASVTRTRPLLEYPDPNDLEDKVRSYLLNPAHPEQKWLGFAKAGYFLRGTDPIELAGLICGIFTEQFVVDESRPTADGAIQFSVRMLLPSRWKSFVPVHTAWYWREDRGIQLSTAYVDGGYDRSATIPAALPDEFRRSAEWSRVHELIGAMSGRLAEDAKADPTSVTGWLWISHDGERDREFAAWVRRNTRGSVFTRRALGGRVTQYLILGARGFGGESEFVAALRSAQALLATTGVKTYAEIVGD